MESSHSKSTQTLLVAASRTDLDELRKCLPPEKKLVEERKFLVRKTCDFDGGKAEKLALARYRQVMWQGRVLNSQFTDEELRCQSRCPMIPEEVGPTI
ncbi:hypothetical protein BVRB_3g060260 [Beta vulgaris subsp. vulgaris]|nr:hypothetical protein BVRB_3g060260 [Beta vulgaris subsp. vulgaris]